MMTVTCFLLGKTHHGIVSTSARDCCDFSAMHAFVVYVPLVHIFSTLGYVEKTHKLCSLTLSGFNCGLQLCTQCCCSNELGGRKKKKEEA